jgi:hypothetical protein
MRPGHEGRDGITDKQLARLIELASLRARRKATEDPASGLI